MKKKTGAIPIIERNGRFILQKTFGEVGQKQVSLGKDSKIATSAAIRFIATAEKNGFHAATEELKGKQIIRAGANPTFLEMESLYRDFCAQSAKPPRPQTIRMNLGRLKFIMKKAGVERIGKIDRNKLAALWFGESTPTPRDKRTFASAISAASGVFKLSALDYYKSRKIPVQNPFKGLEIVKPKVGQYVPMSQALRESIWNDCQTELAPNEALIVLLALGVGLRRAEIEAAIPSWFSEQSDKVLVHVKEEDHFQPKAGEDGIVPIPIALYQTLLRLRGNSDSFYFVPTSSEFKGGVRIRPQTQRVNAWLQKKGLKKSHPIHSLRKECGSLVAKQQGILEASKILRNTPQVCAVHYAGIAETTVVNMEDSFAVAAPPVPPAQALADEMGITLEELLAKLA